LPDLREGCVNTGEVVTGTAERLATVDAVSVAARLEQAAQPGEVLFGREALRLVAPPHQRTTRGSRARVHVTLLGRACNTTT